MSQKPGLIVGWHPKLGYLVYRGQQFVALIAPTRSGKGVGFVIPNLLTYPDSMIVLDVKLENYKYTSLFRQKHGQDVFLFAPFAEDGRTHRWNVFDSVRKRQAHLWFGDLVTVAESFYPSDVDPKTKFFNDSSRNLFVGLALYLLQTPGMPCTMGEIFRQGSGYGKQIKAHVKDLMEKAAGEGGARLSIECRDALNRFLQIPDITLGNVLATFNAPLLIFADPIVDAATSTSDFDLEHLRRKRMTIYFGVQPDRLQGGDAGLLINLFYSQALILNMRELPENNPDLKYQCVLLNDEVTAVGRIGVIAKSNSYIAGYDMRLATIAQSQSQLEDEKLYGKHVTKTLMTNHALQMMYPPRDKADSEEYSAMLGTYTFKALGRSRSRGKSSSSSTSQSDQKRPLMLPQELREMKKSEMIISLENTKPIRCQKAYFYADRLFVDRLRALSPYLTGLGTRKLPNEDQLKHAAFVLCELETKDVPIVDLAALYEASQLGRQAPIAASRRPVTRDELKAMKVTDLANYEQLKESLFKLLPGFANVQQALANASAAASSSPAAAG